MLLLVAHCETRVEERLLLWVMWSPGTSPGSALHPHGIVQGIAQPVLSGRSPHGNRPGSQGHFQAPGRNPV